ncbi:metalloregulator ArsR/SmtB family transcription factor [Nocardioides aquiterrae]|uniref:Ni(II)/Co(II)-sensing metalloregulatory transcriptional repressor NmtR n=1 Tax=Nocardioides aquiterrae TaxID=203799 RepID=A0ABN1UHB6_9ACTN
MGHQRSGNHDATSAGEGLDADAAKTVASILQGLATPSRLHLITALHGRTLTVGEVVEAVGMEQSAVSHQLRNLRHLGFVTAERQGRNIVYRLFDDHVIDIIDQALSHAEHLRLAAPRVGDDATEP